MDEQDNKALGKKLAEANQDKWKAIQKGLDLTDRAANFLGTVFGGASENIGGILSDQTKHWRAKNLDRIALFWKERITERGMPEEALEHLSFGDAFKVIEAASMEDSEDVQRMWADLIANATDPEKSTEIKKVYIDLLKSLSSPEVILLNLLWAAESKLHFNTKEELEEHSEKINVLASFAWRKLDKSIRDTAIQNLVRLRCLSFRPKPPAINRLFDVPRDITTPWPRDCALVNVKEFQKLMQYYEDLVLTASGIIEHKPMNSIPLHGMLLGTPYHSQMILNIPEMSYVLTPMAKDLLGACEEKNKDDEQKAVA